MNTKYIPGNPASPVWDTEQSAAGDNAVSSPQAFAPGGAARDEVPGRPTLSGRISPTAPFGQNRPPASQPLKSAAMSDEKPARFSVGAGAPGDRLSLPVSSFHGMAGRSPAMRRFFSQIQLTAPHLRIATLEGEDGTGKTLAARTLHALGPFSREPFVPCLASLFLAESHATLALPWCPALADQARGGMLFLDRVDDLEPRQQAQLFEFLLWFDDQHERSARGASTPPHQVVVSSNSSLRRMAAAGGIRGDLCSRLTAIRFMLPPLRERREDIPLLAQFLAQRFSQTFRKPIRGLAPDTLPPLVRYSWPGNVRELESVISSAALQTESQWIRSIDLPPLPGPATPEAQLSENDFNLDRVIARHIERTLERTRGNKLRAASMLGISRSTLYRILGSS
ncbi:MAG TPA: sigma 54-interacting transcriptional regulator [Acidisarcina sp.]